MLELLLYIQLRPLYAISKLAGAADITDPPKMLEIVSGLVARQPPPPPATS
jgi:hypothetical protein